MPILMGCHLLVLRERYNEMYDVHRPLKMKSTIYQNVKIENLPAPEEPSHLLKAFRWPDDRRKSRELYKTFHYT
jgi:hypothetical protein